MDNWFHTIYFLQHLRTFYTCFSFLYDFKHQILLIEELFLKFSLRLTYGSPLLKQRTVASTPQALRRTQLNIELGGF
jgi:hypothetical protein